LQWIFDLSDGGGRLLRIKEGHAEPPVKIRFYGDSGDHILSAGEDSTLRSFSTVTDLLNKSFGVASYNRKLAKKHRQMDNPVRMKPIIGKDKLR
jgi:U3 small nucleolar RNA-associated protein 21